MISVQRGRQLHLGNKPLAWLMVGNRPMSDGPKLSSLDLYMRWYFYTTEPWGLSLL